MLTRDRKKKGRHFATTVLYLLGSFEEGIRGFCGHIDVLLLSDCGGFFRSQGEGGGYLSACEKGNKMLI